MHTGFTAKTRWLAFIAGLLGATAFSFIFGPDGALMFAAAQIVGAMIQSLLPRVGAALTLLGALILSAMVIPLGLLMVLDSAGSLSRDDLGHMFIPALFSAALVAQVWCDVRLVIEVTKMQRPQRPLVNFEK